MQTRILSLCDGVTIRICRLLEAVAIRAIGTARESLQRSWAHIIAMGRPERRARRQ
jgi:hypothetical protein